MERETRARASGGDDPCPGKPANQTRWLSCLVRLAQFVLAPAPALPLAEPLNEPAWLIALLK